MIETLRKIEEIFKDFKNSESLYMITIRSEMRCEFKSTFADYDNDKEFDLFPFEIIRPFKKFKGIYDFKFFYKNSLMCYGFSMKDGNYTKNFTGIYHIEDFLLGLTL